MKKLYSKIDWNLFFWLICIFSILIYRFFIIQDYASKYIDEDQAIMWWGTVAFTHFNIHEPHYLGQNYGSMIESFLATPLYLLRIPLEYALPISTLILWFLPFIILSFVLLRKKMHIGAVLILIITLLNNWDYDILTNIPRSFVGGYFFAILGAIVLNNIKIKYGTFFAILLFTIGYINTKTSALISLMALECHLFYYYDYFKKNKKQFILGLFLGLNLIFYCDYLFYIINSGNYLHELTNYITIASFIQNIKNLGQILSSYSLVSINNFPVLLPLVLATIIFFLIKKNNYKILSVFLTFVFAFFIYLSFSKTLDFHDDFIYSMCRFYVFIPYCIVYILYLIFSKYEINFKNKKIIQVFCLSLLCIILAVFKILYFKKVVLQNDILYSTQHNVLQIIEVKKLYQMAEKLRKYTMKNNINVVVFYKNNGIAYATAAINYHDYKTYCAFYERRTDIYNHFKYNYFSDTNVLHVMAIEDTILHVLPDKVINSTLVAHIFNKTGFNRNNTEW